MLLGEILANNLHRITFAMVKWYDYCEHDNEELEIYGCPRLKLLNDYDIVPLDSIEHAVHIIPIFHKKKSIFSKQKYLLIYKPLHLLAFIILL